ncbi:TonB-dependent receptor [soil metagenome]
MVAGDNVNSDFQSKRGKRMNKVKLFEAAVSTMVLAFSIAAPAMAQDSASGDGLEEIVVTAEKRETTAQKTAVAMTVFDAKALQRNGVQSLQDLSKLAPGVSLGQNSANVIVAIRGVSSRDTTEIGDPAVSISTDGFYIQRPTGLSDAIYDLERVEVLRGPQGTLYGRSATGGAINFITAKPTDEFAARAGVGIGNYDLLTTEGMINVPVSDFLSARASFQTTRHDGYRTNEAPARAGDDADATSARLHLLFKPTDRLNVLVTGQYTHIGGVGPTVYGVPIVGATVNTVRPAIDRKGSSHGLPNQFIDTDIKSVQVNANYDLDFATLIYSGGYREMKYEQLRDLDGLSTSANYFNPKENPTDWSHELRMVSKGDGPLKWQFGGYWFQEKNSLLTYYQTYATSAAGVNRFVFDYDVKARSQAVFGQASYEVYEGVTVEGGIRYSEDKKSRTGFQNTGLNSTPPAANVPQNGLLNSNKVTYHAALNWQATPRNLLYAKYDTGYKAGGFTDVFGVGVFTYKPETIVSYEVGSKNRFLDNRLQLNVSAFLYDYKDQQASVVNPNGNTVGAGTSYVINAGKSRIYGAEVELVAQPSPADQIDGSVAYLHGEYTDLCTARATNGDCTRDFSGNQSVQAPQWQINAGIEHKFDLFGGTLVPRAQTHYESKSYLGIENYARQRQGDYIRSDAMLTYTSDGDKWSLQAYVRNLENTTVITVANASFGSYNFGLAAPRTYGVKAIINW